METWLWHPGCGILAVELGASGSIWEHLGDRHLGDIWGSIWEHLRAIWEHLGHQGYPGGSRGGLEEKVFKTMIFASKGHKRDHFALRRHVETRIPIDRAHLAAETDGLAQKDPLRLHSANLD